MDQTYIQLAAQNAAQTDTSEVDGKYLTFWMEKQLYGIPIVDVVQIVQIQEITTVPEFPYYAKGIINLRGSIIPVIDARIRLGKEEAQYAERTCVIVTNIHDNYIGLIVDMVHEVTTITTENIAVPPHQADGAAEAFLTGVGKRDGKIILLLDTQRVLGNEQVNELHRAALA